MKYVLDTNICIYIAKESPIEVLNKFNILEPGMVGMSLVTHAELLYGAAKSNNSKKAYQLINQLIELIPVLPIDNKVAEHYADIRATLECQGMIIGNNDLWIAAHVRSQNKIVVTNNEKEFNRIKGLNIENWVN
ncbi:VapC toxin protein [uncultured Gammaproteobacteria bacterium]|uniref:type II toxin-antitoxin system tRNA(fMet)-specific endonuclease VapC n=1 Tax=Bathymodiolus heckerae thiotrophic gill symbiont TaxID=1052212 RepID=UPI0010B0504A|nr:type II toxin-antitoxin system VapC family toxin [Bathymodiolus heckerae thiotrophic gill symbiont]CAC9593914.1 VapC toxin protein [uncultured Gammaproteobacteria bacterium]CAC9605787.1 VapC toxin protein [uncultured Gammaproteobacteria bacterium]SHN93469.1 VapC toxin protein [Bathymodiolus heckerae thiotrophic gill symbiont]